MPANPFALLDTETAPDNKYAVLEALLAADVPIKKRLSRREHKRIINDAKAAYAIYLHHNPIVKKPETISYNEYIATKKQTAALPTTAKTPVPCAGFEQTDAISYKKQTVALPAKAKTLVPCAGFEQTDAPCFDEINFPMLQK